MKWADIKYISHSWIVCMTQLSACHKTQVLWKKKNLHILYNIWLDCPTGHKHFSNHNFLGIVLLTSYETVKYLLVTIMEGMNSKSEDFLKCGRIAYSKKRADFTISQNIGNSWLLLQNCKFFKVSKIVWMTLQTIYKSASWWWNNISYTTV